MHQRLLDHFMRNKIISERQAAYLKGDSTKIRETLGWKPKYDFKSLMHEMCDHWLDVFQGKASLR